MVIALRDRYKKKSVCLRSFHQTKKVLPSKTQRYIKFDLRSLTNLPVKDSKRKEQNYQA
jgi:hypothetical protein